MLEARIQSRAEWTLAAIGFAVLLCVLAYCGWRINATTDMIHALESHLSSQDAHMGAQDAREVDQLENQRTILDNQREGLDLLRQIAK